MKYNKVKHLEIDRDTGTLFITLENKDGTDCVDMSFSRSGGGFAAQTAMVDSAVYREWRQDAEETCTPLSGVVIDMLTTFADVVRDNVEELKA